MSEASRRSLVAAAVVLLMGFPHLALADGYPRLFGSAETRSESLKPFPKWLGVLRRSLDETSAPETCGGGRCHLEQWKAFLLGLAGRDIMSQLAAVNSEMNHRGYIVDPRNWGVPDYWASPLQFFRKQGDCEDYAISKFLSLRALGVPNEQLRIVVLQDLNLRLGHAVLVVYVGDRAYVLDNQISQVVAADRIRHYKPVFSVNEMAWWIHRS